MWSYSVQSVSIFCPIHQTATETMDRICVHAFYEEVISIALCKLILCDVSKMWHVKHQGCKVGEDIATSGVGEGVVLHRMCRIVKLRQVDRAVPDMFKMFKPSPHEHWDSAASPFSPRNSSRVCHQVSTHCTSCLGLGRRTPCTGSLGKSVATQRQQESARIRKKELIIQCIKNLMKRESQRILLSGTCWSAKCHAALWLRWELSFDPNVEQVIQMVRIPEVVKTCQDMSRHVNWRRDRFLFLSVAVFVSGLHQVASPISNSISWIVHVFRKLLVASVSGGSCLQALAVLEPRIQRHRRPT